MNKDTKELQHRLNKDYLTIDDVKQQGGVGKVYLVVGNDLNTKYWFCKNKYENILVPVIMHIVFVFHQVGSVAEWRYMKRQSKP